MKNYQNYKDLLIWQKGIEIAMLTYQITDLLPHSENANLKIQARRSATSISLNIAEGYGRYKKQSFIYFLRNALDSIYELETTIILAQKIHDLPGNLFAPIQMALCEEIGMITSFINKLIITKTAK